MMVDWENITLLETIITVMAFIGLIVTLLNVGEAMRDLMLGLTGIGGELIPIVAWNNVRNEMLLATILCVYLIVGILGMLTPPNPAVQASVATVLSGVLFVGVELLIVANSFTNRRDRQLLKAKPIVAGPPVVVEPHTQPAYGPHEDKG